MLFLKSKLETCKNSYSQKETEGNKWKEFFEHKLEEFKKDLGGNMIFTRLIKVIWLKKLAAL